MNKKLFSPWHVLIILFIVCSSYWMVSGFSYNPAQKRQQLFTGTTNASGNVTINFGWTHAVAPHVDPNIIGPSDNQFIRVVSVSTTGCVVNARQRTDIAGLLPTWGNLSGATVSVHVTER